MFSGFRSDDLSLIRFFGGEGSGHGGPGVSFHKFRNKISLISCVFGGVRSWKVKGGFF